MSMLERFAAYAQDFERTYVDDDWSRLGPYFTPDAVYEVTGAAACTITGRDAILRGIKKSLDGFDRRFRARRIEVTAPPQVEGDTLVVAWRATYERDGAPPLPLEGRSVVRYAGEAIARLTDTVTNEAEVGAWLRGHGPDLDLAYV